MVLEVLEMSRQERKEQEEKLLNFDVDKEVAKLENQLKGFETARTVVFFVGIVSAAISIFFTKWVVLILALVSTLLSIPCKYVVKLFPRNQKLYNFLYPQYNPEEHNIELIENADINSKNFMKRKKAKKEVLENRKVAQSEINKVFNNAVFFRLISFILAFLLVIVSLMLYIPQSEKETTGKEITTQESIITTTETTTKNITETTTESTTEKTTEKDIHLSPSQEKMYLYVDDKETEHTFWLERDDSSDELVDDLTVEAVVEDEGIVSVEKIVRGENFDYTVFITPKKAGTTSISFKSNKGNYKFGAIEIIDRNPETTTKDTSRTVYITQTGECYHFDSDCGGSSSYSVSLNTAKNMGKRPCDKCVH